MDPFDLRCPYCGEAAELEFDESEGSPQSFVQDCAVCCRPWQVDIRQDREEGWTAKLRKTEG